MYECLKIPHVALSSPFYHPSLTKDKPCLRIFLTCHACKLHARANDRIVATIYGSVPKEDCPSLTARNNFHLDMENRSTSSGMDGWEGNPVSQTSDMQSPNPTYVLFIELNMVWSEQSTAPRLFSNLAINSYPFLFSRGESPPLRPPSNSPPTVHPTTPAPQTQNNQTHQNTPPTTAKNKHQILHPTPVLSAILNILFIVPFRRVRVVSKESFMVSARWEESRISEPIAWVSCLRGVRWVGCWRGKVGMGLREGRGKGRRTSFSILTLPLIPSIWASFWFSSSERTASLYWPLGMRSVRQSVVCRATRHSYLSCKCSLFLLFMSGCLCRTFDCVRPISYHRIFNHFPQLEFPQVARLQPLLHPSTCSPQPLSPSKQSKLTLNSASRA